jgi:hypothetical protein
MKKIYENEFLIKFLRYCFHNESERGLLSAWKNVDCNLLMKTIYHHEIQGFVFQQLSEKKLPVEVPTDIIKTLQTYTRQVAVQNMAYQAEGNQIITALQGKGISFLVLKGLPLLEIISHHNWLRPSSDIDILIHQSDMDDINQVLKGAGFVRYIPENFQNNEEEFLKIQNKFGEMHYFKKTENFLYNVDIHWRLSGLSEESPLKKIFPIDDYPWFSNPIPGWFGKNEIQCLNHEMQFLHLIFHFALHHHFRGLKTFIDMCLFCQNFGKTLNWKLINQIVQEPSCQKSIIIALFLIKKLTGKNYSQFYHPDHIARFLILPGEYRWYSRQLLKQENTVVRYLAFFLLPQKIKEKLVMVHYCLFNQDAFPRRWKHLTPKPVSLVVSPFSIFYWRIIEPIRQWFRNKW